MHTLRAGMDMLPLRANKRVKCKECLCVFVVADAGFVSVLLLFLLRARLRDNAFVTKEQNATADRHGDFAYTSKRGEGERMRGLLHTHSEINN